MIILEITLWVLAVSLAGELYRIIRGPQAWDRLLAANLIAVKGLLGMAIYAHVNHLPYLLDVALIYGFIGYVGIILIANFLAQGGRQK